MGAKSAEVCDGAVLQALQVPDGTRKIASVADMPTVLGNVDDGGAQPIRVPGGPGVVADIVVIVRAVDETGGVAGDEGVRLTVAVAEAFIEQAGGLFVFAVGSVFAVAGAVLVVENAV